MNNIQILKKALFKAGHIEASKDKNLIIDYLDSGYWAEVIFSHSFAKAFFKDTLHGWKWHIQEMVISKEPLSYLKKFLQDLLTGKQPRKEDKKNER